MGEPISDVRLAMGMDHLVQVSVSRFESGLSDLLGMLYSKMMKLESKYYSSSLRQVIIGLISLYLGSV